MKTATLAALALLASVCAARAETITRERVGCRTQEVSDRLMKYVMADDADGYGRLLQSGLASGECRTWKPGEAVRLEKRTGIFACLAPGEEAGPCYWTSTSAIEQPE